jgi:hypothetical protein
LFDKDDGLFSTFPWKELMAALGHVVKTDLALAEFLYTYQNDKNSGRTRDAYYQKCNVHTCGRLWKVPEGSGTFRKFETLSINSPLPLRRRRNILFKFFLVP